MGTAFGEKPDMNCVSQNIYYLEGKFLFMNYQLDNALRLHGRDIFFLINSLKQKAVNFNRSRDLVICNSFP